MAAALQEAVDFYVSTGGNFPTPGDYMLTNHPFINIPKRTIKRHAEKKKPPPPGQLNSSGNAVVVTSFRDNIGRSLMSESTRAFIAQTVKRRKKHR